MGIYKGYKQTEDHKRKRLKSQKKFFSNNPNCRQRENHPRWGMKHSEEAKERMSKSHSGKKLTPEQIEKVRIAMTGRVFSTESIKRMSKAQSGKNNPMWKGGKVSVKCANCGMVIKKTRGRYKTNKRCYCSKKCFYEYSKGKYACNWRGGLMQDKEHLKKVRKVHTQRRTALERSAGMLPIKRIQLVYEDNIKKYGTLTCYLCLDPINFGEDSLEHKIPLSRGGTNEYDNLRIAHMQCNRKKRDRTYEEYKKITDIP